MKLGLEGCSRRGTVKRAGLLDICVYHITERNTLTLPSLLLSCQYDHQVLANIAYFRIPADDLKQLISFFQSLPGWKIEPNTRLEDRTLQWEDIIIGESKEGIMNMGGLYRRMRFSPIMNLVNVEYLDQVLGREIIPAGDYHARDRDPIRSVLLDKDIKKLPWRSVDMKGAIKVGKDI